MYYVYIIESKKDKSHYVGMTSDLKKRLKEHNWKQTKFTSDKIPYKIIWCCLFADKYKALQFEKYLKSGSGIAFRNKRLI